jgi:cyclomaltodextrinase / maltogenic alpha-amylase / neopullulanase
MRIILVILLLATTFIVARGFMVEKKPAPPPSTVKHPEWSRNAVIYELNTRQFSKEGTFRAIIPHLKELKALGVDIIWLMPIHPIGVKERKGRLGSPYAVKDYYAVNPEFGTMEDFKALVKAVHGENLHLIIDLVANHTAWDNPLIEKHPDWYRKDNAGNIVPPVPDWHDVAHLDYSKPGLKNYMIDMMKFWVKEQDIDGFRCDVAAMVPVSFWNEARREIDQIRPTFWLAEAESPGLVEKAFDCDYATEYYKLFNTIAAGKANVFELEKLIESDSLLYPSESWRMYFTSNHDQNSWHAPAVTRLGEKEAALFAFLTFALPGRPLIYNGQEIGSTQKLAFFEKDPIAWKESPFRKLYSDLCRTYKSHPALYQGSLEMLPNPGMPGIFACFRADSSSGERMLELANLSSTPCSFPLNLPRRLHVSPSPLLGKAAIKVKDGTTTYELASWGYSIFKVEEKGERENLPGQVK